MKNRILYFIEGACPTEEENKAAQKLKNKEGNHVVFRNASQVQPGEALERCDEVAGLVPDAYAGFPNAETGKGDPLVAEIADTDRTDGHKGTLLNQDLANAEGNPTPVLSDASEGSEVHQAAERAAADGKTVEEVERIDAANRAKAAQRQTAKPAQVVKSTHRPTAKLGASVGKQTKR